MQQNVTLRARGLYTFPNQLGEVPQGSLEKATNVVIDKDGTITPRRGFKIYGTSLGTDLDTAKQLLIYQDRIIRHWGTTIDVDSDGSGTFEQLFDQNDAPVSVNSPTNGIRIKYQEANGNLYFTSSVGIRKISASSNTNLTANPVTPSGMVRALNGTAALNSEEGWFTEDSTVAYRIVWGDKDNNSNVNLGVPSERIIIANSMQSLLVTDYNTLINNLATIAAVAPLSISGNGVGTTTISGLSSTSNLSIGMTVVDTTIGGNVPANTYIANILSTTSVQVTNTVGTFTGDTINFGQRLSDTNYDSLAISTNSSATTIYNALKFLANGPTNKLDVDLEYQSKQTTSMVYSAYAGFTTVGTSDYFDIYGNLNQVYLRVWFQAGTSIQPDQPLNSTMLQITLVNTDTGSDVATKVKTALTNTGFFTATLNPYTFTVSSANATAGATYTNNGVTYTVVNTIASGTSLVMTGASKPTATGTLTKASGTGDSSITFSTSTAVTTITDAAYGLSNSALAYTSTGSISSLVVVSGINPVFGDIAIPNPPLSPPVTGDLTNIQTYFDLIVSALNSTPGISTYAKQSIGGTFDSSVQSSTIDITFTIPAEVTTANFYQIYRSAIFQSSSATNISDITPDDELQLIVEANPTSGEITAKSITFHDDVPDSFRAGGQYLYTNANSGSGIVQANYPPPLSQDITLFLNNTFYSNTQLKYSTELSLLSGLNLAGRRFSIVQNNTVNNYDFVISQVVAVNVVAGNLYTTSGAADYFTVWSGQNIEGAVVWFNVSGGTATAPSVSSPRVLVQCDITSADTASTVATKVLNALSSDAHFSCSQVNNVVTIANTQYGTSTAPSENVSNADFSISTVISGVGTGTESNPIRVSTANTPSQIIDATARTLVDVVNKNSSEIVYAYYLSSSTDLPGLIQFELRNFSQNNFNIIAGDPTIAAQFNPALTTPNTITAISAANPTVITSVAHGLTTGDSIVIEGTNSTPILSGLYVATVLTVNTFSVPVTVTIPGTSGFFTSIAGAVKADNDAHPNRLFFSKNSEPEAVPLVNFVDVGPRNAAIVRILPLRSSLIILSEAGVYQLSGTDASNFQVQLFDGSTKIAAPDSAAVLNNQIFLFANQGISCISETGVSVISRPIEDQIIPLITPQYTNFKTATFATGYEADRAYLLSTVSGTNDSVATTLYRWNTFTTTWTKWDMSKTCALVDPSQNILYFGASDVNFIEQERKTYTRIDQSDRQFDLSVPVNGVQSNFLFFGSLNGTENGDSFVQTQNLTIAEYNRLLQQLDTDAGLQFKTYYNSYGVTSGTNLRDDLTILATALDSDGGFVSPAFSAAISGYGSSFLDTQNAFNTITALLNSNAGTHVKVYPTSSGTTSFETVVTNTNARTSVITLQWSMPFIAGPIVLYKSITSEVVWSQHHFGDPSIVKQVSESTILFDKVDFTTATAAYASDLAPGFLSIPMTEEGPGIWGGFTWGDGDIWGGEGASYPFRTLVPREKQRCRYISGRFTHSIARENYDIYGISFTYTPVSARGYQR